MNTILGKRILIAGLFLLMIGASQLTFAAPSPQGITNTSPVETQVHQHNDVITISYHITSFIQEPIKINTIPYQQLCIPGESITLTAYEPELPTICRSIIIPDTAKMNVEITSSTYIEYSSINIIPSKGNLPRNQNPDALPYQFSTTYQQNTWYPPNIVSLETPYILRDFRGQVIKITPFQYNPVQHKLRFYTDITLKITPIGTDTVNIIHRTTPPTTLDSDFTSLYRHHFLNFDQTRYTPVEEQGNMLIITYDAFWNTMVPFYLWKIQQGIPTEMINFSTFGNAQAIKNHIATYYNTKGLTYVLLVGDAAQLPPFYYGGAASDPSNTFVAGNDHYPDLFIGRFSAENTDQLATQVRRSIEYERDPQTTEPWYHKGMGVASNQGAGIGDDGEADNVHMDNLRLLLLAYTYTHVDQIYDPSGTATMVTTGLNDGRSIVNYCGHGSPTSWGSTGFSNTHVNALTNDNKLPFVFSVACNNGEFDSYTCFAEAWMRATNNGEPTGAIGAFMSTISQSWAPPMEAQDEFVNLTVHIHPNNIKTTLGGLTANACMSMNDKYGSAGTGETDYWTLFGDPSLQMRTDTPSSMTVNYNPVLVYGSTSYEVNVPGIKNALCGLSYNGQYLGSAYTDASGYALIEFDEPIDVVGDVDFVVTAYNKIPLITTVVVYVGNPPVTPPSPTGPTFGNVNISYSYTASTTDPDGDDIYYQFDWGDGTLSQWVGPFPSNNIGEASHMWETGGDYEIRVMAKDSYGVKSEWSDPLTLRIARPEISIGTIQGSIASIKLNIMNAGDADAMAIPWTLHIKRHPYNAYPAQYNKDFEGIIDLIQAGTTQSVRCGPLFGFGGAKITVTAYNQEIIMKGYVLGFLIIITQEM